MEREQGNLSDEEEVGRVVGGRGRGKEREHGERGELVKVNYETCSPDLWCRSCRQ